MWYSATKNGHCPRSVSTPPIIKPVENETFPHGAVKRLSDSSSSLKVSSKPHFSVTTLGKVFICSSPMKSCMMQLFLSNHKLFSLLSHLKAWPLKAVMLLSSTLKKSKINRKQILSIDVFFLEFSYTMKFPPTSPCFGTSCSEFFQFGLKTKISASVFSSSESFASTLPWSCCRLHEKKFCDREQITTADILIPIERLSNKTRSSNVFSVKFTIWFLLKFNCLSFFKGLKCSLDKALIWFSS